MKIILSEYEKEYINKYAKDYNVNPEAVAENYFGVVDCNFEQDIIDMLNDCADEIRKDNGEYIDKVSK